MLRPLDEDIWIADASLRFGGIEVGARMTVVRLPDGRILLHSPIAASDALVGEIVLVTPDGELAFCKSFELGEGP